jgi:hypothetical protein
MVVVQSIVIAVTLLCIVAGTRLAFVMGPGESDPS